MDVEYACVSPTGLTPGNKIGCEGTELIGEALRINSSLRTLKISGKDVEVEGEADNITLSAACQTTNVGKWAERE